MKHIGLTLALTVGITASTVILAVPADAAMTKSSAMRMMKTGQSMVCDYEHQDRDGAQQGTIYFSRGKMRGDFRVRAQGMGSFESHMIRDDRWQYTWGGPMGDRQGVKMSVDAMGAAGKKNKGFDADQEMEMDCREWREDASMFMPPSNVSFSDASDAMRQMGQMSQNIGQMKCQACDQVPAGAGREQCRQAMGC